MQKPFAAVLLGALVVIGLHAGQAAPIRADQAKASVGQLVTVEGLVVQISREPQSGFTYLNFEAEFPRHVFRVVVPHTIERLIDQSVLRIQRLSVRGVPVIGTSGTPEIVCSDPLQLSVAASSLSAPTVPVSPLTPAPPSATPTRTCSRICTTGKACGNTCIARTSTCRQPPGTACNG